MNWLKKLYNKLFGKKEVKPAVTPTIQPIAPVEIKPVEAKPEDRSVTVGREDNRVTLAGPTAAFLGATGNEKPVDVSSGPVYDTSSFVLDRSGSYVIHTHSPAYLSYTIKVPRSGKVEYAYAHVAGGNSGALITSYVIDSKGNLVVPTNTRVLANEQHFSFDASSGDYFLYIAASEEMPLQVVVYF